jgi:hypothetical protein
MAGSIEQDAVRVHFLGEIYCKCISEIVGKLGVENQNMGWSENWGKTFEIPWLMTISMHFPKI